MVTELTRSSQWSSVFTELTRSSMTVSTEFCWFPKEVVGITEFPGNRSINRVLPVNSGNSFWSILTDQRRPEKDFILFDIQDDFGICFVKLDGPTWYFE